MSEGNTSFMRHIRCCQASEAFREERGVVLAFRGEPRRELPESFWIGFTHDVEGFVGELVYDATLDALVSRIERPCDCGEPS